MQKIPASAKNNGGQRILQCLRLERIAAQPPFYSVSRVLLLCLLIFVLYAVISSIHQSIWAASYRQYWYYDSPFSVLLVVCIASYRHPQLLALSRWRPRWIDLAAGVSGGVLVPTVLWLAFRDPVQTLRLHFPRGSFFVPMVFMGPVVEEMFFRGTVLKSFKSYLPRTVAVLLTSLLVSILHPHFWTVLPMQLMVSVLYVALGDSLPASIAAHITNNAFVFLLATGAFERWHAYIWSLGK